MSYEEIPSWFVEAVYLSLFSQKPLIKKQIRNMGEVIEYASK